MYLLAQVLTADQPVLSLDTNTLIYTALGLAAAAWAAPSPAAALWKSLKGLFLKSVDKDGDGKLSAPELLALLQKVGVIVSKGGGGKQLTIELLKLLSANAEANADGIDLTPEISAMWSKTLDKCKQDHDHSTHASGA